MRAQMADHPAWRSAGVNESLAATRPEPRRAPRHGTAATVLRSSGVHEAHDLLDRFGYTWLTAWSRVQLGTLDVAGGQLAEARALLDEALDLSLAIHINRNMALCLVAFARLTFAEGDPEQAAVLARAAAGLWQRARRRAWPVLRRGEADLVAQVRQAQGAVRFDEVFPAGSWLSQREAVAAIRGRRRIGAAPAPTRFLAVRGLCLLATGLVALPLASAIPPPSPCCSPRRSPPYHGLVFPGGRARSLPVPTNHVDIQADACTLPLTSPSR